jgi:photosystem II oxygen-evolving enhancer protein 1
MFATATKTVVSTNQRSSVKAAAMPEKAGQAAAAVLAASLVAGSAQALTYDDIQGLTYLQVKGSGIANTCPVLEEGSSTINVGSGTYHFEEFCMEPTQIQVKEETGFKGQAPEFQTTKLLTRLTYTLTGMEGTAKISGNNVEWTEEEGIDFAPTTVKLPGGEMVPFMYTMKQLQAKGTLSNFGGEFQVPSYRGATFLDPKGRGASTGYDTSAALPAGGAGDEDALLKENIKNIAPGVGKAVFSTAKYDPATGEIAGVFQSIQPSDTDMGAKVPKDVKINGIWYARLTKQ